MKHVCSAGRKAHVGSNVDSLGSSSTENEPLGHPCKVPGELVSWSPFHYVVIKPILSSLLLSPCATQSQLVKVAKI